MLKQMFAVVMAILFSLTAHAKGSSYGDSGDTGTPHNADLIFKIDSRFIMYRLDGYMLVCLDKNKKTLTSCSDSNDRLTLEEFWKWYFPLATTLRVVAMEYRTYQYIFWLKR
jgi:hypothetical protein